MYKKMYNVVTIGGPETTPGTAVARTDRLPITDLADVKKVATKNPSEVLTGRGTNRGNYIDSIDVSMDSIPMELQAIKATGKLFVSCLGKDLATPQQVGGAFVLSYTGAEKSAKIVVTDTTITSSIGELGAEVADTDFGTAGTYTFASLATDVAALQAEPDYSCEKLFGADALVTAAKGYAISAAQISGGSVIVYFTSADSGIYLHRHTPDLTNTERPTMTVQSDGTGLTNDVLSGAVFDSIDISAELKGRATITANAMGLGVESDTASAVSLLDKKPLKFANSTFFLAGVNEAFVKSLSLSFANNHDSDEGFGTGSYYKQDHSKGDFAVTGSISLRSNTGTEVEYAKRITENLSSLSVVFKGDNLTTDIPEMIAINVPYIDIMSATKSASGVSLDSELTIEAVDPQSYNEIVTIDMLTTDSDKYN